MLLTPHSSFQAIPGSVQTHQLRSEGGTVQQGKAAELAGFTSCHRSHDSEQDSVAQNGGCLGDITPILNELNRAEFKQITFILCQAPLASTASEVVPFSLVLLGCSFSFPGGRKVLLLANAAKYYLQEKYPK